MGSLNFQRTGKEPVMQGRFFDRFFGFYLIKEPWLGGQTRFFDFFRNWVASRYLTVPASSFFEKERTAPH
jgi:hypothetical protein